MRRNASVDGTQATDNRATSSPAMLDVQGFADTLNVSTRTVRRLVDGGKCPSPVRFGRVCRWPRPVVDQWIADGCPNCRARKGVAR